MSVPPNDPYARDPYADPYAGQDAVPGQPYPGPQQGGYQDDPYQGGGYGQAPQGQYQGQHPGQYQGEPMAQGRSGGGFFPFPHRTWRTNRGAQVTVGGCCLPLPLGCLTTLAVAGVAAYVGTRKG